MAEMTPDARTAAAQEVAAAEIQWRSQDDGVLSLQVLLDLIINRFAFALRAERERAVVEMTPEREDSTDDCNVFAQDWTLVQRAELTRLTREVERLRSEVWTAHVPVTDTQHDPSRGLIHGCCERCRMPWPCDYSPDRALTSFAPRGFGADPPAGREDELGKTAAEIVGTSSDPGGGVDA